MGNQGKSIYRYQKNSQPQSNCTNQMWVLLMVLDIISQFYCNNSAKEIHITLGQRLVPWAHWFRCLRHSPSVLLLKHILPPQSVHIHQKHNKREANDVQTWNFATKASERTPQKKMRNCRIPRALPNAHTWKRMNKTIAIDSPSSALGVLQREQLLLPLAWEEQRKATGDPTWNPVKYLIWSNDI